jgi:hypothetical protein
MHTSVDPSDNARSPAAPIRWAFVFAVQEAVLTLEDVDWRKTAFVADGCFFLLLAVGFALHVPGVVTLWPWIEQPLCRDFLAALLAAYGAGCLFLAYLGEWSAAVGGSVAMLVAFGGFALQVTVAETEGRDFGLGVPAIVLAVIATIAAATLYLSCSGNRMTRS